MGPSRARRVLDVEHAATQTLLRALQNSGKTFFFTSGTSVLSERTDGDWSENSFAEEDAFVPRRQLGQRVAIETMVRQASGHVLRTMCIRPPLICGHGGCKIIAELYHSANKTGEVCYVGRGLNVYSSVHVDDVADVFSRALAKGVCGALYHCVSGEVDFRTMAEAIAQHLGIETRSVSVTESIEIWDKFTGPIIFASSTRSRSPLARSDLGWEPQGDRSDILTECVLPAYSTKVPKERPSYVRRPSTAE